MTLREFRRRAGTDQVRAVIVSDGCRDYVIELHTESGAGLLTDWRGRRRRFASLAQAKHAVRNVDSVELAVRIAADEACAGTNGDAHFSRLKLVAPHAA